jgi:predicted dehydrogenase
MGNPYGTHQIHVTGEKGQIFGSNNELYLLPDGYSQPAKTVLGSPDTFIRQMEHFATCLQKGKCPIHSVKEGREVLEVILAATKDADGWQKVAVQKKF